MGFNRDDPRSSHGSGSLLGSGVKGDKRLILSGEKQYTGIMLRLFAAS